MSSWASREVARRGRLKAVLDLRVRVEGEEDGGVDVAKDERGILDKNG